MRSSDLATWVVVLLVPGCFGLPACFGPIDHEGRRCPCATGFVCDTSSDRCVREGTDASGHLDAEGERDTGARDASDLDARPMGEDAFVATIDAHAGGPDATGAPVDGGDDAWLATADAWAADARVVDAWAPDAWAADARAADVGAVDARVLDAWAPDAASTFVYCPTGAFLCDDFESADADRVPPWGYSDGMPSRATDRAARGSASGRFSGAPPAGEQSIGVGISTDPSEVWARFWLLVRPRASASETRDGAVFHLGDDTAPRYDNISVVLNEAGLGTYNTAAGMFRDGPTIPDDTWTCVALHVVVGDPGTVELYVGSSLVLSGSERTVFAGGPIRVVDAGLTYLDVASDRITVYLDDVAVRLDGIPLLCPPAGG